jgi:hypothetical protein
MNNLKISLVAIAILVLAGCATPELPQAAKAQRQVINFPAIGSEAEAEIGQTLFSKANLTVTEAIEISTEKTEYIKQTATNNRYSGTIKIPAGKLAKFAEDDKGAYYRSHNGIYKASLPFKYPVGVFVPKNTDTSAVLFVFHEVIGSKGYEFGKDPVEYKTSTIETWSKDSFKRELIYGGLSQKTIQISYREFFDETARPAFTQELKYDLNDGDVIGFRGARFQVLKANNTSIRYKTLKALD